MKNFLLGFPIISKAKYKMRKGDFWIRTRSVPENIQHIKKIFDALVNKSGLGSSFFEGKTLIEIGPGDTLGVALMFIANGAQKVICIDSFKCVQETEKHVEIYEGIVNGFEGDEWERCQDTIGWSSGSVKINPEKIQYLPNIPFERADMIAEKSVDVIYSYDVLEHTINVRECFRQMKRLLKKGGYCIHEVDLAGHGEFDAPFHPLDFLRFSPRLWHLMNSNRGAPNRVRFGEYMNILSEMNLEVVKLAKDQIPEEEVEKVRPFLSGEFKKLPTEELSVVGFWCVAKSL